MTAASITDSTASAQRFRVTPLARLEFMRCHWLCIMVCLVPQPAQAAVVEYQQIAAWISNVPSYTTVDFTGYPDFTTITTQYESHGVTFTDGSDQIFLNHNAFPNDGAGLYGAIDTIHLEFTEPMHHIAVEFPGSMQIQLYWQSELTYTSSEFIHGGVGFFAGLVSDLPFDAAIILDPTGNVNIDDLHFGPPIPAPGALAMLAMSMCAVPRRRRSR